MALLSWITMFPSWITGLFPNLVGILALNSGGASPFGARREKTSLYGSESSSSSHAMRMARLAPRKYRVMSESCWAMMSGDDGQSRAAVQILTCLFFSPFEACLHCSRRTASELHHFLLPPQEGMLLLSVCDVNDIKFWGRLNRRT